MNLYRRIILYTLILTSIVVVFGAYVRLADAGLGCPDWPGCYGKLTPTQAAEQIREAYAADPFGPVSMPKAWKEMIHRYLATAVGLLIIAIAAMAWRRREDPGTHPVLATTLIGVVIFQGILGAWTVTMLLKPAIVTSHLIGGMTTLAMLAWLNERARAAPLAGSRPGTALLTKIAFVALIVQIILGGWVSTNYAALACTDFPTCHGSFWPDADYSNAFHVVRELGMTPEGELLSFEALVAIHWMHRVGALVAGIALLALGLVLRRDALTRRMGDILLAALVLQIVLGIANVWLSLPLLLAAAHNAGAALLVVIMIGISYRVRSGALVLEEGRNGNERASHEKSYA
jgi:cytochrome c oxidase assembly protein subunit 15